MSTNDITKFAAQTDATFGFAGKHGYSAELVGASSEKAATIAQQMIASLDVAKTSGMLAALGGVASFAALGQLDPLAIGAGALAGVASSLNKGGSKGR